MSELLLCCAPQQPPLPFPAGFGEQFLALGSVVLSVSAAGLILSPLQRPLTVPMGLRAVTKLSSVVSSHGGSVSPFPSCVGKQQVLEAQVLQQPRLLLPSSCSQT